MIVSMDTPTAPVIYTDMANEAYHAERDHISRSTAHRYKGIAGGRAQRYAESGKSLFAGNSATTFGTLVDLACECEMAGTDWRSRIVVPPQTVLASDGSRRGKAFTEWRQTIPTGGAECSAADLAKVSDIIASLREHREANALIEAATHSQYSVFWQDDDGHKRKARADGVTKDLWFDLKTTSSEWWELKYSFRRFAYDWQDVWYREAARVAGWAPFTFQFVVVQTFAPFDVAVLSLEDEDLIVADQEIRETLNLIRERRETGIYVPAEYHAPRKLKL